MSAKPCCIDGFAARSSSCFNFSRRSRFPLRTTYVPFKQSDIFKEREEGGGIERLTNLIGNLRSQSLLVNHLLPDVGPRHFVEFVHGRRDGADEIVWHAADLEEAVKNLAGVEFNGVFPLPPKALKNLVDDPDLFIVRSETASRRRWQA